MTKQYLGDAVYVEVEHGMLKLTTEDGIQATNTIYLEPEVFAALVQYYDEARKAHDAEVVS
jgi:hypothetical protein